MLNPIPAPILVEPGLGFDRLEDRSGGMESEDFFMLIDHLRVPVCTVMVGRYLSSYL